MTDSEPPEQRGGQKQKKWVGTTWVWLIGVTGALILFALVVGVILDWYINPGDAESKRDLVKALAVDAPLRFLEIVSAWPVILLLLLILFRRPIGEFINEYAPELLKRIKSAKVPGGIEIGFAEAAEVVQDVVKKGAQAHGNDIQGFRDFVVEQTNKLPRIAAASPADQANLQGRHLLWVDDNPANNVVERNIMERLGATIALATSTDEALEKVRQGRYDVIISDMGRAEKHGYATRAGYDLLDNLRAADIMTPFIIYAGSNAPEHRAEAQRHGALGSTNNPQELFQLVSSAVQKT